ncbi:cyclase family protein [Ochrobactrum sp. XJ1]|nr:cyclase family protein [Ochrobactrum sp. XJ1]
MNTPSGLLPSVPTMIADLIKGASCIDLAPKLEKGIPRYPTHPHLIIDPTIGHERDGYYCQTINMPEHIGCHCDAPAHIHKNLMHKTIESAAPDCLVGLAKVYDFSDRDWKPGELLTLEDIEDYEAAHGSPVSGGEIALVNFGWLERYWSTSDKTNFYALNQPGMDDAAAKFFLDRGVKAVGADTIACEIAMVNGVYYDNPGHGRYWLPNDILILECVANLEKVPREVFLFSAPLPIAGGSGSPLRPLAFF